MTERYFVINIALMVHC